MAKFEISLEYNPSNSRLIYDYIKWKLSGKLPKMKMNVKQIND